MKGWGNFVEKYYKKEFNGNLIKEMYNIWMKNLLDGFLVDCE